MRTRAMAAVVLFASSLSIVLTESAHAADRGVRVVFIAVGPENSAAGSLQQQLGALLAQAPDLQLVDVAQLGVGGPGGSTEADRRAAEAMLEQVGRAYYDGNAVAALERLEAATRTYEALPDAPIADRVRVHLWRAALRLGAGDAAGAEKSAREVVALEPERKTDLGGFPPQVGELVEKLRKQPSLVAIKISATGAPARAEVWIDDRLAAFDQAMRVPAGLHYVRVSAPGYRTVFRRVEAKADVTVPVALQVALPPDAEKELLAAGTATEQNVLERFGETYCVDAVAVVATRSDFPTEVKAVVWSTRARTSQRKPFVLKDATPRGLAGLSDWIQSQARALGGSASVAGDVARAGAPSAPGAMSTRPAGATRVRTDASIVFASWSRSLRGTADDGGSYSVSPAPISGTGVRVAVAAERDVLIAELAASLVSFGLTRNEVRTPDPANPQTSVKRDITGGEMTTLRAGGGARLGAAERLHAELLLGFAYEDYVAKGGAELPLFTSQTRLTPEARVRGVLPYGKFTAAAELGAGAGGRWKEQPVVTGDRASADPAFAVGLSLDWAAASRLRVGGGYGFESRGARFHGEDRSALEPGVRDARQKERLHTLHAIARYAF